MTKDYVSDNLDAPSLEHLFPNMIVADKRVSTWPWLRREIDHPFRVDRRNPIVGFINRDEAAVLYSNARLFAGRKGVEIGAWRGWSTAHLIASGLGSLHVIEPLLADPVWRAELEEVARAAGGTETIFVPEASPAAIERLGEAGVRWSLAFIDGDHDGEAPTRTRWPSPPISSRPRWSCFTIWSRPMWRRAFAPWKPGGGTSWPTRRPR